MEVATNTNTNRLTILTMMLNKMNNVNNNDVHFRQSIKNHLVTKKMRKTLKEKSPMLDQVICDLSLFFSSLTRTDLLPVRLPKLSLF